MFAGVSNINKAISKIYVHRIPRLKMARWLVPHEFNSNECLFFQRVSGSKRGYANHSCKQKRPDVRRPLMENSLTDDSNAPQILWECLLSLLFPNQRLTSGFQPWSFRNLKVAEISPFSLRPVFHHYHPPATRADLEDSD